MSQIRDPGQLVQVSTNYQVLRDDRTIIVDADGGNVVVTLPLVGQSFGRVYYIKRIDSSGNTVTVSAA